MKSSKNIFNLSKIIVNTLSKNKGFNVIKIDLKNKSSIADSMIICSGTSNRHIISLANYLYKELKELGLKTLSSEGKKAGDWIVIDAGDVIVHIFREEVREYYNLEKMWDEIMNDVIKVNK